MIAALLLSSSLGLLPPAVSPDKWAPFRDRIEVSQGGEYGVLLRRQKKNPSLRFEILQRAPGAPPLVPVKFKDAPTEVTQLAVGELDHPPLRALVSSTGLGFAAIERYARIGYGQSITTVNAAGQVVTTCTLADLFTEEERALLPHTVSSYRWLEDAWIDEDAAEVLVYGGGKFFAASFETPNLRVAGETELIRALEHGGERGAQIALELLLDRKLEALRPSFEELFKDAHPLATRLRAGLALAKLGDGRAAELYRETAGKNASKVDADDLRFTLRHLHGVLAQEGLPLLRASMRGEAGGALSAAIEGFVNYGEDAVPTLIEMLREIEESDDYRGGAANALQNIGSKKALEPLLQAVSDKEEHVAHLALVAAIQIDKPGVAPRLTELLEQETTQLVRLLAYFQEQKHAASLPALRRLYDATQDAAERKRIASAIEFQSEG